MQPPFWPGHQQRPPQYGGPPRPHAQAPPHTHHHHPQHQPPYQNHRGPPPQHHPQHQQPPFHHQAPPPQQQQAPPPQHFGAPPPMTHPPPHFQFAAPPQFGAPPPMFQPPPHLQFAGGVPPPMPLAGVAPPAALVQQQKSSAASSSSQSNLPNVGVHTSINLYIGKIAPDIGDEFLQKVLETCGQLIKWNRMADASTKTPKSFGFAEFCGPEAASRALRVLKTSKIEHRSLLVNIDSKNRALLDAWESVLEHKQTQNQFCAEDPDPRLQRPTQDQETTDEITQLIALRKELADAQKEESSSSSSKKQSDSKTGETSSESKSNDSKMHPERRERRDRDGRHSRRRSRSRDRDSRHSRQRNSSSTDESRDIRDRDSRDNRDRDRDRDSRSSRRDKNKPSSKDSSSSTSASSSSSKRRSSRDRSPKRKEGAPPPPPPLSEAPVAAAAATTATVEPIDAKALIQKIPKQTEELLVYQVNWPLVDSSGLVERVMRKWITERITEYLGKEEIDLTNFIIGLLATHQPAKQILQELTMVLGEDAEAFVVKMWRRMIFETLRLQAQTTQAQT